MRAIILAGGKGTRLRPYTVTIPKPLVPVGDVSIMEILLRQLAAAGCSRVTVAVGHQAQLIMAYFGDGRRFGIDIDYSVEERPLSTIAPLRLVPDLPDHFLVMNGDVFTDLDFGRFFREHVDGGALGTVAGYAREEQIDFGVLECGGEHRRLTGFVEKPVKQFLVSMGVYAFARRILDYVPGDRPFGFDDLMATVVDKALDVRVHPYGGYWLDIGRPGDLEQATFHYGRIQAHLLRDG